MNMKLAFFCLFVCLFNLQAQQILTGNIVDENEMELPYSNVQILSLDSIPLQGSTTDSLGCFTIRDVKAGEYLLSVSYIGYITQVIPFEMPTTDYQFPPIILKTDKVVLNEVKVTGNSFIQKKDHLLIIPDKQQIKHAFGGYDLLYNLMIPGLTIDRKNKTVTSLAGKVTLYINGVEADMREIQALQPKDIERVEYYVMPKTGQFTGDAASVNYITKIYKTGGYITLDGDQTIGYTKGIYNIASKILHNNTSYIFFGGAKMAKYNGTEIGKSEDLFFPDHTIHRTTMNNNAHYKSNQQYAQFKVSNNTKKCDLSASASFVRDDTPNDEQNRVLNYNRQEHDSIHSFERRDNKSQKGAINLTGAFRVDDRQFIKVRLNGAYTKNKYNRLYTENEQRSLSNVDEDLYSFDAFLGYNYKPNEKNSLYTKITHFHNITSTNYGGDYFSLQHLWEGETLLATEYTHTFNKKVMAIFAPGVSWINYKLRGQDLQEIWNLRLNTGVRCSLDSKQWLFLIFALGNNQPDISYLNTANQTIDFYQIKRGNPYLDNTQIYTIFGMYEGSFHPLFNVQGKLYYEYNKNNVYNHYSVEGNKLISSYASNNSFSTTNVEIAISSRFSENFRTNVNLKYNYMNVPEVSGLHENNFFASLDVNYFIKAFAINAYAKTTERKLDQSTLIYTKTPAIYGLSVRYSGKNWMAEVGAENPFTKHQHYREYANYGVYRYNQVQTSRIYQQTAYVKLAYTFDFGKKTSRENKDVDRSINSAILKAR